MQLTELISAIQTTHEYTQRFAVQQANVALTIRNWVIGFYIVEYEQQGEDRAEYGTRLFKELGRRLASIKGTGERNLYLFKDFYLVYPWILQTVSAKLQSTGYQLDTTFLSMLEKLESIQSKEVASHSFPADMLLSRLSFSHFIELVKADTPLKRAFYEVQAIKNNWSVRELGRAMSTLLFERSGLSTNKESVIGKVKVTIPVTPADVIKTGGIRYGRIGTGNFCAQIFGSVAQRGRIKTTHRKRPNGFVSG
ncbi:MAG: DUF1016 N-terminal domain-containing protein [Saprospiraceae bacterium]|nr:DUF1016 N-terminal domain-containing protein [Saprospiraceae bacterium]